MYILVSKYEALIKKRQRYLPKLDSVNRITNLPIVESGWNYAEYIYNRIKTSNRLICWTFNRTENSILTVVDTAIPIVILFEAPIHIIDKIVCHSLDIVEERIPAITLPPEEIYNNTKQYVTNVGNRIARPVLKRADSVKQMGNQVLASKYTVFAAHTLDEALNVADMYVDKYLPPDASDEQEKPLEPIEGPTGKAIQTIHHMDRFSRKLQRRLTKRTLAEAKALKEQSTEAIHVLLYVAELIATDPKLAFQKGKELWAALSKDEPENQAAVENLEQLLVLLTREASRRIVHFINFTSAGIANLPVHVSNAIRDATNKCLQVVDSLTAQLNNLGHTVYDGIRHRAHQIAQLLQQLNSYTTDILERLAHSLSGCPQPLTANANNKQIGPTRDSLHPPNAQISAAHRHGNNANAVNGVEGN